MADKSLTGLVRDTAADVSRLVKLEAELAAERAKGSSRTAGISAGAVGMGMTFAVLGLLFLLGATAASLAIVLPVWASLLIVGGGAILLGGMLAVLGLLGLRKASRGAARSTARVKEDLRWLRERTG